MKIKNIYGKDANVNIAAYTIDWDKKVSKPQKIVKDIIRPIWAGDLVCEEFRIPSSKLRIDLINFTLGVVVEVSPKSSHSFSVFFHKNRSNFLSSRKRDIKKEEWSLSNGFIYIELIDKDLADQELIFNKLTNFN